MFQTQNGKQNIIPIDHSFIFSSLNYLDLDPTIFSPIHNDNIFVSRLGLSLKRFLKRNKNWLPINKEVFYLCVENCKREYAHIVENIPTSWGFTTLHQEKLYQFLFNEKRNEQVFEEFNYKLI